MFLPVSASVRASLDYGARDTLDCTLATLVLESHHHLFRLLCSSSPLCYISCLLGSLVSMELLQSVLRKVKILHISLPPGLLLSD